MLSLITDLHAVNKASERNQKKERIEKKTSKLAHLQSHLPALYAIV